ncbi:MAG: hypothetical protein NTV80_06180 [Verrucomicrobia bacterium]|nr:hypothetical protein [Verrucomicrobiota bacterium]
MELTDSSFAQAHEGWELGYGSFAQGDEYCELAHEGYELAHVPFAQAHEGCELTHEGCELTHEGCELETLRQKMNELILNGRR